VGAVGSLVTAIPFNACTWYERYNGGVEMTNVDRIAIRILQDLLADFRARELDVSALKNGYVGLKLAFLKGQFPGEEHVDFDLALKEIERKKFIDTGPKVAHENRPGSGIFIVGVYSKREHAYLTENGYKESLKTPALAGVTRMANKSSSPDVRHFYGIHPQIKAKCASLYEAEEYAEAVEKSFKVVRDRLRTLTGHETGSEAFGKGHLYIRGAVAKHVDADFNQAVKFLTMAIDMFRNEKSHSSDAKIEDPIRAHQYLSLSSLAMYLLEGAEVRAR